MPARRLIGALTFCVAVLASSAAYADHDGSSLKGLSSLLPNLFGKDGILLAPPQVGFSHQPHFTVESQEQLNVLNDSLRSQLSLIPLPSPASGFTFRFDPTLGAFTRATDSFGPIYSQRADTTGKGKLTFGFSYSRFTFDELDGKSLDGGDLQVTFTHEPTGSQLTPPQPPFFFEADTITAQISAKIVSNVFVFSATYGLLDNLDLSIAVPLIFTSIDLKGVATINRTGTQAVNPNIHRFDNGTDTLTVRASDESFGIGDIVLRAKWNFLKAAPILLAAGLDLRLPSGSVDDLRGVGTVVVSPAFIFSTQSFAGFSPHVNVGVHISADTSKVENEFFYNVGVDWAPYKALTVNFDILGRYIINNGRLEAGQLPGGTKIAGSNLVDAALGFKLNVWKNVLGVLNVLMPLNSNVGLRDHITPLFGVEVSF